MVEGNPAQSSPWKQNGIIVVAVVMNLEIVKQMKTGYRKIFSKKVDFESDSSPVTGNVCCHYNRWMNDVCMAYMFDKNSGGKASQIEQLFEANLRSFG